MYNRASYPTLRKQDHTSCSYMLNNRNNLYFREGIIYNLCKVYNIKILVLASRPLRSQPQITITH